MARNVGIAASSGKYVAFLDQDDLWFPEKLEAQFALAEAKRDVGLVHTQFEFIDRQGTRTADGFGRAQSYCEMLEGGGICGASTVLARKDVLLEAGLFDALSQPAEDLDLWLRVARRSHTEFIPDCLAQYRLHDQNQTRHYLRTYKAIRHILGKHILSDPEGPAAVSAKKGLRRIRSTFGAQAFDQARLAWRSGQWIGLAKHMTQALNLSPGFVLGSVFGCR